MTDTIMGPAIKEAQEVECVPVETCSGHGELIHPETKTDKGRCSMCGAFGMTMRPVVKA